MHFCADELMIILAALPIIRQLIAWWRS